MKSMKHAQAADEYIAYAETIKRLSAFSGDAVLTILSAVVADVMLQLTSTKHGAMDTARAKKLYGGVFKRAVESDYPLVIKMHQINLMQEAQHETKQ